MRLIYGDAVTAWLATEPARRGVYNVLELYVEPEHRNEGVGTGLMRELCADADREEAEVWLVPVAYEEMGTDEDRLVRFYERFGFRRRGPYMIRRPGCQCARCQSDDPGFDQEIGAIKSALRGDPVHHLSREQTIVCCRLCDYQSTREGSVGESR